MILSKSQLVNNINTEISDQSVGQISPYNIRHNLIDIIDSVHNLLNTHNINAKNIGTPEKRNAYVGTEAFKNDNLPGSNNHDNTAIGHNALRSIYQSFENTAVGSYALGCNVYGSGNIAFGYQALGSNVVGNANIGIGLYTLHNNKAGQNNIAIGRGAGYYVEKDTSNKLFIASHSISAEYICDNPEGIGLVPLIYGDFATKQIGINVRTLHNNATLQVSGNVTPYLTDDSDLGISGNRWRFLNLSSGVYLGNNFYLGRGFGLNGVVISGSLIPSNNDSYVLGDTQNIWQSGFFKDLKVDGTAYINQLNYLSQSYFTGKYIYLAINDTNEGYLTDEELVNGGLVLKSTDNAYNISFYPASSGLSCFSGVNNKSTWRSNISFEVPSGSYIRTNSLVSYEPFNDNCYGLFFDSGVSYISRKNVLSVNPASEDGHIAGIGNVNFISNSGEVENYSVSISSLESGVFVSQRFLTGTKQREKDATNENADKLQGFEIKYIDDSLSEIQGFLSDRLIIESYNNTSKPVNGLVIMKDSEDGAVCGITNISSITEDILPATILNVRSDNEAIIRLTSETTAYEKAALQLLGNENCETSGVELSYLNNSGISDLSIFKDGARTIFIRLNQPSGSIGILSSGITNEAITIGHSGISGLPVISLKDSTGINNLQTSFTATPGYGKIYNINNYKAFANQHNDLKFLDPSGNLFDLIVNKYDNIDARAIYTDNLGNTFGGHLSPSKRLNTTIAVSGNTTYGNRALSNIISGSGNIAIGNNAASGISRGSDNIVLGVNSFNTMSSGTQNIIIGNRSFIRENTGSTTGNIIIGHNGLGNSTSASYQFLLGINENIVLLNGTLGPNDADKNLTLPKDGKIFLYNSDNQKSLRLYNNIIELNNSNNINYPTDSLVFRFRSNQYANLLTLNHNAIPLTNVPVYNSTNRPYAQLDGDLKIQGNINFSDNTVLGSAGFLPRIDTLEDDVDALTTRVNTIGSDSQASTSISNNLFIEGYAVSNISNPSNASIPTSGQLRKKNASWEDDGIITIVNRDTTCTIKANDYIIAIKINNEYRPIWLSAIDTLGSSENDICCS